MCGRFTITMSYEELKNHVRQHYKVDPFNVVFNLPRYNVAPGQEIIAVINDGSNNRIGNLKWGFLPSFAKDEKIAFSMINAKAETIDEKISYRQSFEKRRCIILADSFYEWKRVGKDKTPMRILRKDRQLFAMAGIWNTYVRLDGTKVHTCAIITTPANQLIAKVHDRMPAILDSSEQELWLNPKVEIGVLKKILDPYPEELMTMYQVSDIVNNSRNETSECIVEVMPRE